MDKLKNMEPKKLAILTAAIVLVLGVVGAILSSKSPVIGIVLVVAAAGLTFFLVSMKAEQEKQSNKTDKYRKLFRNLPIGFAQARIISDATGEVVGYQVVDANDIFGTYFNLDREKVISKFFRI